MHRNAVITSYSIHYTKLYEVTWVLNRLFQEPEIPSIGGFSAVYISDSLAAYRDQVRPCEDVKYPAGEHKGETTNMCKSAEQLSEEEATLVADHYAGKPFVRAKQSFDAGLAEVGKGIHDLNCKKCRNNFV